MRKAWRFPKQEVSCDESHRERGPRAPPPQDYKWFCVGKTVHSVSMFMHVNTCVHPMVLMCPVCVQELMCVGEDVHMSMCKCRSQQSSLHVSSGELSTLFLRQGCSLAKKSRILLTGQQAPGIQSLPQHWEHKFIPQHPVFLLTELSLQLKGHIFLYVKLTAFHRKLNHNMVTWESIQPWYT